MQKSLQISGGWNSFFQGSSRQDPIGGCLKSLGELPEQPPHCTRIAHPNVQERAHSTGIAGSQPG